MGGLVVGIIGIKAISAQFKLKVKLGLAKITKPRGSQFKYYISRSCQIFTDRLRNKVTLSSICFSVLVCGAVW